MCFASLISVKFIINSLHIQTFFQRTICLIFTSTLWPHLFYGVGMVSGLIWSHFAFQWGLLLRSTETPILWKKGIIMATNFTAFSGGERHRTSWLLCPKSSCTLQVNVPAVQVELTSFKLLASPSMSVTTRGREQCHECWAGGLPCSSWTRQGKWLYPVKQLNC